MVRAQSGNGKSTLVEKFFSKKMMSSPSDTEEKKPFLLRGKYDEFLGTEPLSAFVDAFGNFGKNVAMKNNSSSDDDEEDEKREGAARTQTPEASLSPMFTETEIQELQDRIREQIDSESAAVMLSLIPSLSTLFPPELVPNNASSTSKRGNNNNDGEESVSRINSKPKLQQMTSTSTESSVNQMKYIFPKFCNCIGTKDRPLILFLDDLQWIDPASSILLQSLLTDRRMSHFMFVGTYRTEEVIDDSELSRALDKIQETRSIEYIDLQNLTIDESAQFVAGVLGLDDPADITELNELIYSKTEGNILFTRQVLEQLFRERLLEFSRLTFQWEWHLEDKDALEELLSKDVVEAILEKIRSQPVELQTLLKIAAYMRSSSFNIQNLYKLCERIWGDDPAAPNGFSKLDLQEVQRLLDYAVLDGLLSNGTGSSAYSFAHDRIQQASYALIPVGPERDAFALKMGLHMLDLNNEINEQMEDENVASWMLYAAADHLNSVVYSFRMLQAKEEDRDPLQLVKLNLRVGEMAAKKTAYATASKYLQQALRDLEHHSSRDFWSKKYYELAIELYGLYATVELSQGNFELGRRLAQQVLDHAVCTEDTLYTRLALALAFSKEGDHVASKRVLVDALRLIDMYPARKISVTWDLLKDYFYIKKYLQTHSDEDILSLPHLEEGVEYIGMQLLLNSADQSYYLGDPLASMVSSLFCLLNILLGCILC